MMKTEIERLADDQLKLSVEVPADELDHAMQHTMEHLAADMQLPGFRRGKVPPQMVLARLGREAVIAEVINHYLGQWYVSAVSSAGIRPVAEPEIDMGEIPAAGQPLAFTASVQVAPKPKLPKLDTLSAERPVLADIQPMVDEVLDATLAGAGELTDTGEPAVEGDEVLVDFTCSVDGEPVEGAAALGYQARIGAGRLLAELEEAIIGTGAGTDLTVPVDFPADHPMSQLAGKQAQFELKVRSVQTLSRPKLDDDIARKVSEFDTAKELDADIRSKIQERLDEEADSVFRANAVGALADAAEVEPPAPLVESRKNDIFQSMRQQLEVAGTTLEGYLSSVGQDFSDFTRDLDERAGDDVRRELVLLALAEDASIEVSDDDLWDEVRRHATEAGEDPERAIANIKLSGRVDVLRGELLMQRTVDHLVEHVKTVEYDPKERADAETAKAEAAAEADPNADSDAESSPTDA